MRLKKLEIKGFKSFADNTVINFDEDVIGIVGPNGSGKSNIVDSIRWVLGEQKSKELRLDKMTSVIFNGTRKRKQGGIARVSLTFENTKNILPTDYQTVEITRVLYRSGDSEYKLNGISCRLKDITSLFMDTGIGSNSYAIIALGMVDDILADNHNSRRKMFEQAAGISKYKARKKEALNKLKHTSDDLDRIEDLLYEINNNLKRLEKEAKRAKRYFEIKDDYKERSIDLAVLKIRGFRDEQNALKAKIEKDVDTYRAGQIQERKLEADLQAEKKANIDKEKELSSRQRELNQLISFIRNKESDKRILEQRQQFTAQNKAKIEREIQTAQGRIEQLDETIQSYRARYQEAVIQSDEMQEALQVAEVALERVREGHSAIKTDLDQVIAVQQDAEKILFELEKQKAVNASEVEHLTRESNQAQLDIGLRIKEVEDLKNQLAESEQEEKEQKTALDHLQIEEDNRLAKIEKTQEQIEKVRQDHRRVNRQLDAQRNEFKLTQSMIQNLEGFPDSIRFLSSNKQYKAPLLSDIIFVQEAYRVAIENYLEPYLNYYVVQNAEEAYQAIQLLNQSQKGKARFFLLDAFKDYVPPMAMFASGTPAIQVVEVEKNYRILFEYLLENVVVTDSEDIRSMQVNDDTTILSKSGSYMSQKYSLSGGSIGLFEGKKIGRKKNLEILEKNIAKLESQENKLATHSYQLQKELESLKSQSHKTEIHKSTHALNEISRKRVSIKTRLENFETFIAEVDEKSQKTIEKIQTLTAANIDIDKQLESKMEEVSTIKQKIANMDGSYRNAAEELSTASANFNQRKITFIQEQNKVASFERELAFKEDQLRETTETLNRNQYQLQKDARQEGKITDEIAGLQAQLLEKYEERKVVEKSLTTAEQNYYQARGGINEIEDKLRALTKNQQEAQILINQLKEKLRDVKFEVGSIAQRLKIEFELDINEVINAERDLSEVTKDILEEKVFKLKRRLENYGDINPMAVEAYDEMSERHTSITKQRDDITEAKELLEETIKEIEETATHQFLDAFTKARTYFIDVFRSLFTAEDNCDLILLEPDNPLESKIEIVAKPKGKRPQTISQLSGGEKTLTATALLFALYLLKPAPFCIFDEVDAPLDDANILKFNKIIKKFSKDSQFIIVTHNKLTMAAVDTIYGVYMAEQGVSGVSAVDFRDFDHKATFEVANR